MSTRPHLIKPREQVSEAAKGRSTSITNDKENLITPSSSWIKRAHHSWETFRNVRHTLPCETPEFLGTHVPRPTVSVMVITYNHARFIAQALDSIRAQEGNFTLEINVIDDASTDGTQDIVREYAARYPGIVRPFFNAKNVGHIATQLNTYRGFQTLRGKYFALLEGDDYWIDQSKLAKQLALLELNPQFVACGSSTLKIYDDGSRAPEHFLPFKAFSRRTATIENLIGLGAVFHLSGTLYRNIFGNVPPMCFADEYSCEVTINMVYGQFGDFFHIDEYMSAYRVHGKGVFSHRSQEDIWLFHLHGFLRFALYLGPRYPYEFARAIASFSWFVLNARRKGLGPPLKVSTLGIFSFCFVLAYPTYKVLAVFRRLRKASKSLSLYDAVVALTPRSLADRIVSLEERVPRLHQWRHRWKHASQSAKKE